MLSQAEWRLLTRLYGEGKSGIAYEGRGYAGVSWSALLALRRHNPPLAREVTRPDPRNNTTHYLIVITEAGEEFYENHHQTYNALYPP